MVHDFLTTSNMTVYFSTSTLNLSDDCAYGYDTVDALAGMNVTDEVKIAWPCVLREYWHEIKALALLTQGLMSYGTTVVISVGLLLNMLSLRILSTKTLLRHSSNNYLLALSVYDSCVLIFNFLVGVLRASYSGTINRLFQQNEWLCILHSVFVELFSLLSIWMIVCLSVERLIAIFIPFKVKEYCSMKKTKIAIVAVSLMILTISCHKILLSGFEGDSVFGYKACHTHRKIISSAVFFYVAFNTWLPTLTIIIVNILIAWKVKNAGMNRKSISGSRMTSSQSISSRKNTCVLSVSDMKVVKTMKAVSITYLLLILPLGIMQSFELYWNNFQKSEPSLEDDMQRDYVYYQKGKITIKHIRIVAFFFYQWNFAVNFFIYFVRSRKFRCELQRLFPWLPIPKSLRTMTPEQYQLSMSSSRTNSTTLFSSRELDTAN